ncbi:MAG: hypothetical protein V1861_04865 [Candidatus Micrarchaeota archaeon]
MAARVIDLSRLTEKQLGELGRHMSRRWRGIHALAAKLLEKEHIERDSEKQAAACGA